MEKIQFQFEVCTGVECGVRDENRDADSFLGITQIRSKILYVCMTVYKSQCTRASVLDECAGRVSHRMVDPPCQLSESAIKIE